MYKLFFYTPPYRNSNQMAHIIEHTLLEPFLKDKKTFISYYNEIEANTNNYYTEFSLPSKKLLDNFIENMKQPISQQSYTNEDKRIKDELIEESYQQGLFDFIQKYLWKNLNISTYKKYALNTINNYQKKYYNRYIITDKNFNIISSSNIDYIKKTSYINNSILEKNNFSYSDTEYILLSQKFESDWNLYYTDFIYTLYGAWLDYYTHNIEYLYFPYTIYYFMTEEKIHVVLPKWSIKQLQSLDKDFFLLFQNHYLKHLYTNKQNIIAQISNKYSNTFSLKDLLNISFNDIQPIL